MEWQPIETAPRDGTEVLIVDQDYTGYMEYSPAVGHWHPDSNEVSGGIWMYGSYDMQPTHWMPLPEPPKTEDKT